MKPVVNDGRNNGSPSSRSGEERWRGAGFAFALVGPAVDALVEEGTEGREVPGAGGPVRARESSGSDPDSAATIFSASPPTASAKALLLETRFAPRSAMGAGDTNSVPGSDSSAALASSSSL